jgi:hypothetical protein
MSFRGVSYRGLFLGVRADTPPSVRLADIPALESILGPNFTPAPFRALRSALQIAIHATWCNMAAGYLDSTPLYMRMTDKQSACHPRPEGVKGLESDH